MKRTGWLLSALALMFASCASNQADVYVANPCDTARYVVLSYSAILPADMDQLTGKIGPRSISKIGKLGTENLRDSHLQTFLDSDFRREAGKESVLSQPSLQKVGDEEIYLVFVRAEDC